MDFMTQVANVGKKMTSREQIVSYFQARYPGETRWRSEIAKAIQPFTRGKSGGSMSYQNVRRRFEGSRWLKQKMNAETRAEYEKLGAALPKMQPERGYHVKGKVCISIEGYPCEERQWDYKVIGENADFLYQTGSLQGLVNCYMAELFDTEQPSAELCDDEDACNSKVKVTALSVKGQRNLRNIDQSWS